MNENDFFCECKFKSISTLIYICIHKKSLVYACNSIVFFSLSLFFNITQSTCILSALNLTDENAIISVRLQNYSNATPLEAFDALKVINGSSWAPKIGNFLDKLYSFVIGIRCLSKRGWQQCKVGWSFVTEIALYNNIRDKSLILVLILIWFVCVRVFSRCRISVFLLWNRSATI